jgi:hypothetical protein
VAVTKYNVIFAMILFLHGCKQIKTGRIEIAEVQKKFCKTMNTFYQIIGIILILFAAIFAAMQFELLGLVYVLVGTSGAVLWFIGFIGFDF